MKWMPIKEKSWMKMKRNMQEQTKKEGIPKGDTNTEGTKTKNLNREEQFRRNHNKVDKIRKPDQVLSYFFYNKWILLIVTVTGIIYNVGMVAGPYFEGQLIQKLYEIIEGTSTITRMVLLAVTYIAVILVVQGMRTLKRFYVRRFANDTNRNMRHMLYNSLVFRSVADLQKDTDGAVMTKAISDVDSCVEGMRKLTTEIFDTGVVLVAYVVMLFCYDFRLAALCCLFPPVAYILAERLKTLIYRYTKDYRASAERLNNATTDRISGALLYRISGVSDIRNQSYHGILKRYEKAAVKANVWENAMQPLYLTISSVSVIFILYFGSHNVTGSGWTSWDIAAFTTFLSCFTKMAKKSSSAAKLFNAVQKAQVSWKRIKPLMQEYQEVESCQGENSLLEVVKCQEDNSVQNVKPDQRMQNEHDRQKIWLQVQNLSFAYPDGKVQFSGVNFKASPGDIIGVTGPVASGKSTLGKTFLYEYHYQGSIQLAGMELSDLSAAQRNGMVTYMGHDPELFSASIRDNICLGEDCDCEKWLRMVSLYDEIMQMEQGVDTKLGNGGMQLSGGQQARLALARTLCHGKKLLILDDPLSAVDKVTEQLIMEQIRRESKDRVVLMISHRLELFPTFDQVIWLGDQPVTATHEELYQQNTSYRELFQLQEGGYDYDEQ